MQISAALILNKFYDCRYNVVPTTSSGWTTVTFDPNVATYDVRTRTDSASTPLVDEASPFACPSSPAGMDALSLNSTIRAFVINVGDSSASDLGINGYLDKAVFSTVSGTTTYDFEFEPKTKDQCKDNGWMFGLGNGLEFKNQGDCVSYFATGMRNAPAGDVVPTATRRR